MNYNLKNIRSAYYSFPYPLRCVFAAGYGWRARQARYGKGFSRALGELRVSQYWSPEKVLEYESNRITQYLQLVKASVPFYADKSPNTSLGTLDAFPIIAKSLLRSDPAKFVSKQLGTMRYQQAHTSGTTGSAMIFPLSLECFQREYAFRALHYEWGGVSLHRRDRIAICAGHPVADPTRMNPPFWVYDAANNWLFFSSYHLAGKSLSHYVKKLEECNPVMLHGYPSSVYILALAYKKYGRGRLRFKSVFTSSETLLDYQRHAIEDAFQVKVYNWYGNSEMCANIVECERGRMHLKREHSHVEVLNHENRPCLPGETGRLICTGFGNEAFALVRYDIGDTVTIAREQHCPCERPGPLIERIDGRIEEYVVTPDGRLVGRLDHIFKDSVHVREAQIIQRDPSEVTLRIVMADAYSTSDEMKILEETRLRLGDRISVRFEYVESIPRTVNGKFRFVDTEIRQESVIGQVLS